MATKRRKPFMPAPEPTGFNEPPVDAKAIQQETEERTVNGVPVSSLPIGVQNVITFEMTDQGIAARNANRPPSSGAKVLTDDTFDKRIQQRGDMPWLTNDPLLDAVNAHRKPGFQYRGLSEVVIRKRTMRGWKPVREANGDLVKVGNLLLGEMPIEMAEQRNEHYRKQGQSELAASVERMQVDQERLIHDARSKGIDIGILRDGEVITDSSDPDRSASIGVHRSRGA